MLTLGALALLLPSLLVERPLVAAALLVAPVVLLLLLTRLPLALGLLVVTSPFENYLDLHVSPYAVKALGVVVILSAVVNALGRHLVSDRAGPVPVSHPVMIVLIVFVLLMAVATTANPRGAEGLETALRYLSFALVCAIGAAAMREGRSLERLLRLFVLASTASATCAVIGYFVAPQGRAGGPLDDPNDLAFFFAVAVPLGTALALRTSGRSRWGWWACLLVLLAGMGLTLSRGAALALLAALLWGLAQRHVRALPLLVGLLLGALALGGVAALAGPQLSRSLDEKSYIADRNVDTRSLRWQAAGLMALDNPAVGLGPAGFRQEYVRYARVDQPDDATHVVSHQMYLEIAAELGIPALLAFLTMLALAWRATRRAGLRPGPRAPPGDALLAHGVAASLVVAMVGSLFLTEQYYLPIWLLIAAAVALETRAREAAS